MRTQRFFSLFAAALIAFAPMHAAAQDVQQDSVSVRDRPRPEYDPLGMRFGGFNLNASVDLSATSTDNLFAEEDAFADDDIIFRVSPYARLASNWSRHAMQVEAGAAFTSHEDFSSEDAETYWLRGVGRLDIGVASSVTLAAGVAHEVEPRTDPDSPLTPDPVEYDRNNVSLTAQHTFNRFRITGEVARTEYDFEGTQSFRDSEENRARGRIDAEITPRIGAMLEYAVDERTHDNAPGNDSDGQTVLAGVVINFTDLMRGELTAGHFERDYVALGSTDGLAVAGNLEWYITRLTTLNFHARRNTEDVIGATAFPYVESEYGAQVDHELLRNVILSAGVRGGDREYEVIDRDDEFVYAHAGAEWLLNRRLSVRGRYEFSEVDSSGAAAFRDFEVNAVTVGLTIRL